MLHLLNDVSGLLQQLHVSFWNAAIWNPNFFWDACKNIPKDSPKRVNNFQHSLLLSVALVLIHF